MLLQYISCHMQGTLQGTVQKVTHLILPKLWQIDVCILQMETLRLRKGDGLLISKVIQLGDNRAGFQCRSFCWALSRTMPPACCRRQVIVGLNWKSGQNRLRRISFEHFCLMKAAPPSGALFIFTCSVEASQVFIYFLLTWVRCWCLGVNKNREYFVYFLLGQNRCNFDLQYSLRAIITSLMLNIPLF